VVECAGVRLRCRSSADLETGVAVTLSLRYERVGLANGRGGQEAVTIPSVLTERTFMGSTVRITARSASGLTLVADIADLEHAGPLIVGSPVELQVGERAITVLQD
jgi:hypothetical protein